MVMIAKQSEKINLLRRISKKKEHSPDLQLISPSRILFHA